MTIIWCGAEDIDFMNKVNYVPLSTESGTFRSSYSRCGIILGQNATFNIGNSFSPISEGWFGFWLGRGSIGSCDSGRNTFGLCCNETQNFILLHNNGGYVALCLHNRNLNTNTILVTSGVLWQTSRTCIKFDINFSVNNENGFLNLYREGILIASYTGNLLTIPYFDSIAHSSGSTSNNCMVGSEFIIADEDTRLLNLFTLVPNAAGDVNEWDAGAYTDIDELDGRITIDSISTNSANKLFLSNLSNPSTGKWSTKAIQVNTRVSPIYGATLGFQIGIKTNSVVHLSSNKVPVITQTLYELFTENPETENEFTTQELEALQIAIKSV